MAETLIDIENSSISPTISEQDATRLSKIKKWLIDWTILPEHQNGSFNSTPYFMTLVTLIRLILFLGALVINFVTQKQIPPEIVLFFCFFAISCIGPHIFIGIPLEITYGPLRTSVFYILSIVYSHIVGELILNEYDFLDMDPCAWALFGLHFANVVKNWNTFPRKYLHLTLFFIFGVLLELWIFKMYHDYTNWRVGSYHVTCGIAGFLYGFLNGFFWVYRNKEEDKPETPWRSFSIILTCLVVYLIIAEFSGIHITFEEYKRQLFRRS